MKKKGSGAANNEHLHQRKFSAIRMVKLKCFLQLSPITIITISGTVLQYSSTSIKKPAHIYRECEY